MTLTAQQQEIRRTRCGGSDIGALLGISPHKTPLDVFAEKTLAPTNRDEDAPWLQWGTDVEASILKSHERAARFKRIECPGTLTHPDHDAVCSTMDGLGVRESGSKVVLETKNAQGFNSQQWGEPGSDDAPLLYVAQVQMELGCALARIENVENTADLVATIGGAPPVAYRIKFDPELFGTLVQIAEKFVRDHLQTGKPPDNWHTDKRAADYLARKYQRNNGSLLYADEEVRALAASVASMRATAKACDVEKVAAENLLKARIGDADGYEGVVTWKRSKDSTGLVTDWAAVAREVRIDPEIIAKHTTNQIIREGSRRLLLAKEKT